MTAPWLPSPSRRRFLGFAGGLLAAAGLGGCVRDQGPLKVGAHFWPGYEFMFLARSQGWFSHEQVQLVETRTASDSLRWLKEGRIDAAALTLDEALIGLGQGIPLKVVLVFDISAGADAALARPGITRPQQLKGLRIGAETSALGRLMLAKLLQKAGLRPDQVLVENIAGTTHLEAWQSGRFDALITYEPALSQIEKTGAVRLFDSLEIPDTILDVLVIRRDRADVLSDHLQALVRAHFRGIRDWRVNPVDTAYRMARRFNVHAEEVAGMYRGIELPDLEYNRHLLGGGAEKLHATARELAVIVGVSPAVVTAGFFDAGALD